MATVRLYNWEKGQAEDVPEELATQAIVSKTHAPLKGQPLNYIDAATGEARSAEGDDLVEFLTMGGQLEGETQRTARVEAEQYGEGWAPAKAALLGGASGLTFGLSNQALVRSELVSPDTIKKLRDYNPGEYYGSEIGAAIGSMLIPGGQIAALAKGGKIARSSSAALRAARAAGSAPRLVAGIGQRAAGIVGKNAIARAATSSAVEGAFYATGQLISEEALGDTELTAQQVINHIGMGALLGGAFGGGITAGGIMARKAAGKLRSNLKSRFGGISDDMAKVDESRALDAADDFEITVDVDTGTDVRSKASAAADADGFANADATSKIQAELNDVLGDMAEGKGDPWQRLDEIKTAMGDDWRGFMGDIRKSIGEEIDDLLDPDMLAVRALGGRQRAIKEITRGISPEKKSQALKDFGKILRDELKIVGKMDSLDDMAAKAVFKEKELGKLIGEQLSNLSDASPTAFVMGDDIVNRVRSEIGKRVKSSTSSGRKALQAIDDELAIFQEQFGGKKVRLEEMWRYKSDLKDLARWDKGTKSLDGMPTQTDLAFRAYQMIVRDAVEETAENAAKGLGQEFLTKFRETKKLYAVSATAKEILNRGITRANGNNLIGLLEMGAGISAAGIGDGDIISDGITGIGAAILMRAARGRAPQLASHMLAKVQPSSIIMKMVGLASVEEAKKSTMNSVANSVRKATAKGTSTAAGKAGAKASTKLGTDVSAGTSTKVRVSIKRASNQKEATKKAVKEVHKTTLEQHVARIENDLAHIEGFAPRVAAGMAAASTRALLYLKQQAPKDPIANRLDPDEWEPPAFELSRFSRIKDAVDKPGSVLDKIASGEVTTDEVAAIRNVYPELYADMVDKVVSEVAKKKGKVPFETKAGLSILLGVAVDPAFERDFIAKMQELSAPKQAQDAARTGAQEIQSINSNKYLPASERVNQTLGGQ